MDVQMGVDPAGDRARLYDGHSQPFSVHVVKGWHARPEGDRDDRAAPSATRPPTRTERGHETTFLNVVIDPSFTLVVTVLVLDGVRSG